MKKHKGDALLLKFYIADFLTKKQVTNHGEIPQYYVEDNHEAIIEPEIFDRVQDMIREQSSRKGYSGVTIFSSKIQCGCCGNWYGSKVWHSTDKYRRVVWQCNAKFKNKNRCTTPHLMEDEIRDAFIRVANSLITDRDEILSELRLIQDTLSGTEELEAEQKRLAEQMNVDADTVQEIIAENARVAQTRRSTTSATRHSSPGLKRPGNGTNRSPRRLPRRASVGGSSEGSSSRWKVCRIPSRGLMKPSGAAWSIT